MLRWFCHYTYSLRTCLDSMASVCVQFFLTFSCHCCISVKLEKIITLLKFDCWKMIKTLWVKRSCQEKNFPTKMQCMTNRYKECHHFFRWLTWLDDANHSKPILCFALAHFQENLADKLRSAQWSTNMHQPISTS